MLGESHLQISNRQSFSDLNSGSRINISNDRSKTKGILGKD